MTRNRESSLETDIDKVIGRHRWLSAAAAAATFPSCLLAAAQQALKKGHHGARALAVAAESRRDQYAAACEC
jgi:formyltetrahydrofolate hydrolase